MAPQQDLVLDRLRKIRSSYAPGDHGLGAVPAIADVARADAKIEAMRAKVAEARKRARGSLVKQATLTILPSAATAPHRVTFGSAGVSNSGFLGGEQKARELFNRSDINGDGVLNLEEFTSYLTSVFEALAQTSAFKAHGISPVQMASATAEQCFKDADADGNGALSFNEFKAWFQADPTSSTTASVAEIELPTNTINVDAAGTIAESEARTVFNRFDENGDGVLSLVEFTKYLESVFDALSGTPAFKATGTTPAQMAAATAEKCFDEADADGNGSLTFDEFKAWFRSSGFDIQATPNGTIPEVEARALFNRYDANGDDLLDFNEFETYLTSVFEALAHTPAFQAHGATPAQMAAATAEQCFDEADADGNGSLTFDEFKAWFQADPARQIKADASGTIAEGEARVLFSKYDTNGDNVLDRGEFETYLTSVFEALAHSSAFQAHGATPAQMAAATAQQCFSEADSDSNGTLTFEEFKAWFQADPTSSTTASVAEIELPTNTINVDAAGTIAESEARTLFNRFDENGDGVLSLVEFTKYLESVFDALSGTPAFEATGTTPAQMAAATAEKCFDEADADGNGSLTFDEFKAWFRSSGFDIQATPNGTIAEVEARALFNRYDANGDDLLDFNEFETYLTSVFEALAHTPAFQAHDATPAQMAAATAEQCFDEADADGNGSLTFDEFKAWFQADPVRNVAAAAMTVDPGGMIAESDARALFHKYDEDSNGLLDLHEFTNYLTSVFQALAHTPAFQEHGASPKEMAEATAEQCFDEADEDGNGSLTFDEFKAWFQAGPDKNLWIQGAIANESGMISESDARALFDKYDDDSSGTLDLHEFTNYLTSVFEAMAHTPAFQSQGATPAQMAAATAEQCFDEADDDGNGTLSFEEFKAWFNSSQAAEATTAALTMNPDGTIEESEAQALFLKFDANGDGVLDYEEFTNYLLSVFEAMAHTESFKAQPLSPTDIAEETAANCFEEADKDGNGTLTFEEFKAWFQAEQAEATSAAIAVDDAGTIDQSEARSLFDRFDENQDGVLDFDEFTNYLTSVFEALSHTPAFQAEDSTPAEMAQATAEQCFEEADDDGNGNLTFDEFRAWLKTNR